MTCRPITETWKKCHEHEPPKDGRLFIGWDAVHQNFIFDLFYNGSEFMTKSTAWSGRFDYWMNRPGTPGEQHDE